MSATNKMMMMMMMMRRPISCTSLSAMAFHVPAVSMATGQNRCVLAIIFNTPR